MCKYMFRRNPVELTETMGSLRYMPEDYREKN